MRTCAVPSQRTTVVFTYEQVMTGVWVVAYGCKRAAGNSCLLQQLPEHSDSSVLPFVDRAACGSPLSFLLTVAPLDHQYLVGGGLVDQDGCGRFGRDGDVHVFACREHLLSDVAPDFVLVLLGGDVGLSGSDVGDLYVGRCVPGIPAARGHGAGVGQKLAGDGGFSLVLSPCVVPVSRVADAVDRVERSAAYLRYTSWGTQILSAPDKAAHSSWYPERRECVKCEVAKDAHLGVLRSPAHARVSQSGWAVIGRLIESPFLLADARCFKEIRVQPGRAESRSKPRCLRVAEVALQLVAIALVERVVNGLLVQEVVVLVWREDSHLSVNQYSVHALRVELLLQEVIPAVFGPWIRACAVLERELEHGHRVAHVGPGSGVCRSPVDVRSPAETGKPLASEPGAECFNCGGHAPKSASRHPAETGL